MRRVVLLALAVVAVVSVAGLRHSLAGPAPVAKTGVTRKAVCIGVYDSRAIAVAWAASAHNPVAAKRAEMDRAKAAGDSAKVTELEAWGPAHQRKLHFQGFGRVPVDDLLAPVKAGVARVAREKGLAAITMSCDHTATNVEVVDVTSALVELYKPSERTRQVVRSLKGVQPLGLVELADMKATD